MKNLKNDIRIVFIIALAIGSFSWLGYAIWDEYKPLEPPNDDIWGMTIDLTGGEVYDEIIREPIPQWFIDEFNETFIGSYSVQIEDDKLNIVIITTGKQFYDLRQFIEGDNHNWQGGYMGTDTDIDLMEWDYVVKPETDDGKTYGIIHPGATTEGDAE